MTVSILRLLGVRPRERGQPGAQLRVGLGSVRHALSSSNVLPSPLSPVSSVVRRPGLSAISPAGPMFDVSQHFVPLDGS